MAYEIPSEIAYTEKIAFGLSAKQLVIAIFFAGLIYLVLVKTNFPQLIKWILGIIILVLGGAITFFKLDTFILQIIMWCKFRSLKLTPESIKSFFRVTKFEKDYFVVNKIKTAVIEVTPTNFSIKSDQEREAVIKIFQKLLQAIDFPTQYYIKTECLSIDKYLQHLNEEIVNNVDKSKKKIYSQHCKSLQEHLNNVIKSNNIINRKFYIIIPEQQGLSIQVNIIEDKIKSLGLKCKILKKEALEELISEFFKNSNQDEILSNNINDLQVGTKFHRIISAHGYPRNVEPGFLDKIITTNGDFDISIHVTPYHIETMMVNLNKELQKQRADLWNEQKRGVINPALEIKHNDTRTVLENLQKGQEKLFDVSLYINCRASSRDELDLLTRRVESELNSVLIVPKVSSFKQINGIKSIAPIGRNILKIKRNIPTNALSAFFPFTSKFLEVDQTGIWFGQNKNNIPLIIDNFKFSNPNGVILATSGAGKSYLAKLLIARHLLMGTQVIIIDPQGEYTDLVEKYKGQVIDFHTKSESIINPFDLMDKTYEEKRLFLMDLAKVMFGELSPHHKSIIDRAINSAYEKKGITDESSTWNNLPPKFEDVLAEIRSMKKKASDVTEYGIMSLENKLSIYVEGVFKFLNRHTRIELNNQLICFNIHKLPKQVQPLMMFVILDFVYSKMQNNLNRKILVIDEAWKLLSRVEDAMYILEIVKTCRKFNMGLLLINQEVEDLVRSDAGKSVLANSSYTILLKQKPSVIKDLVKIFDLSNYERDFLLTANVGEGLLRTEKDQTEIRILASEEEHKIITTNADEKLKTNGGKKMEEQKQELDFKKIAHNSIDLSTEQVKELETNGYKEISYQSEITKKEEKRFVKLREGEPTEHICLICDIIDYLRAKGLDVKFNHSGNPDIEFTFDNKKWGIEVQTGEEYLKRKKQFQKKIKLLNRDFGERWFYVLTNPDVVKFYSVYKRSTDSSNFVRVLDDYLSRK